MRAWMAFWPGLAGIWLRGKWFALVGAAAFALVLNMALLTTFVWPRLLSRDLPGWALPLAAWVLVLWFWIAGRQGTARILAEEAAKSLQPDAQSDDVLSGAQNEYLKGHWMEAQAILTKLLSRRPGDAEARLLLASVYRRSGRLDAANEQLSLMAAVPGAAVWHEEIAREMRRLAMEDGESSSTRPGAAAVAASAERRAA